MTDPSRSEVVAETPSEGEGVLCPCCGWTGTEFLPFNSRPNAKCPNCGALERHRAIFMFLRDRTSVFVDNVRLLHFAPEPVLMKTFRAHNNINYVSTDLDLRFVSVRMDITDILFRDNTFDFIICSHVLEHVIDDRQAMREMYRVLKPGGRAIVLFPFFTYLETTYEDPSITSFEERAAAFGQGDHVRKPGRDYPERLTEAGFVVDAVDYAALVGEEVSRRHGLCHQRSRNLIFVCSKDSSDPSEHLDDATGIFRHGNDWFKIVKVRQPG